MIKIASSYQETQFFDKQNSIISNPLLIVRAFTKPRSFTITLESIEHIYQVSSILNNRQLSYKNQKETNTLINQVVNI